MQTTISPAHAHELHNRCKTVSHWTVGPSAVHSTALRNVV